MEPQKPDSLSTEVDKQKLGTIKDGYVINHPKKQPRGMWSQKWDITQYPERQIGRAQSGYKATSQPATAPTSSDKATLLTNPGPCVVPGTEYLDPPCTSYMDILHKSEYELAKIVHTGLKKFSEMPWTVWYLKRDGETTTSFKVASEHCSVTDPRWQLKHLVWNIHKKRNYSIMFQIDINLLQDLLQKLNDKAHKVYLSDQIIQKAFTEIREIATVFYGAMQHMKDIELESLIIHMNKLEALKNDSCELEKYKAKLTENERVFEQMKTAGEKEKVSKKVLKSFEERRKDPAALQMMLVQFTTRLGINLTDLVKID